MKEVIRISGSLDPLAATPKQSAPGGSVAAEAVRWREPAQQLRVDSIRASAVPKSGHPTSSMSAAELMAVLMSKYFRYDFDKPDEPGNDHLIFSKGHASPLLYSMYKGCGAISDDELLTFRSFGSRLEGHPSPVVLWVDVALTHPSILDPGGDLARKLRLFGLPTTIFLNEAHREVSRLVGETNLAGFVRGLEQATRRRDRARPRRPRPPRRADFLGWQAWNPGRLGRG